MSRSLGKNIVWANEKKFNLYVPDGFEHYLVDFPCDAPLMNRGHNGRRRVMVWGFYSYYVTLNLYAVEGTINAQRHIALIGTRLRFWLATHYPQQALFQHDNATEHNAKATIK